MTRPQWIEVGISFIIATVLTVLTYWLGMYTGWITSVNWLEFFAVWTTYSCTYLCVMQSRLNYPIGTVSNLAFAVLFFQQGLPALAALQFYLIADMAYGWFRWGPDGNPLPVSSLKWDWVTWATGGVTVLGFVVLYATNVVLGGSNAALDIFCAVGSITAQFLMDNKKIANWYVWLVIDVVSVYLLWTTDLKVTAVQFLFFIANAVWGWYEWRKTQR